MWIDSGFLSCDVGVGQFFYGVKGGVREFLEKIENYIITV